MRTTLAFAFLVTLAAAQTAPFAAWQNVQSVTVPSAGFNRLDLPLATLNAAQHRLEDLRLADEGGTIVPYVVEWPLPAATRQPAVQSFHVTLQSGRTVLDMETGTDKPIRALMIDCAAADFIKAISIEASSDRAQWTPLVTDEMIFRQRDGAARTAFVFASPKPWTHLRATIRDDASHAVPFTGARIEWQEPRTAPVPLDVTITKREELAGKTRLALDLGAAHLSIAELKLHVADPLFSRRVEVQQNGATIAHTQVHRLTVSNHPSEDLVIPVFSQLSAREITVVVFNNDSPPLRIESLSATRDPVGIAFRASAAGMLRLYSGNVSATEPSYDLTALANDLRQASAGVATIGDLMPNNAFDKTATLPETGAMGAVIDLKPWAYRKAVAVSERGVISIELDLDVLAHASESLSDLRLIQNGQQLPFIIQRPNKTTTLPATIAVEPADPKRPTLTRWRVTAPQTLLPVRTLTLTSPTPVFERYLRSSQESRDSFGNKFTSPLAARTWSHRPNDLSLLKLSFDQRWSCDSIVIETDNGDNAPIQINSAKIELDVTALVFKTTDPTPVHLYYGNTRAVAPRYDLRLVEKDLTTATPVLGKLDPEEELSPSIVSADSPNPRGTPWLWAALSVVVIGLIAVMAKLLPKTDAAA